MRAGWRCSLIPLVRQPHIPQHRFRSSYHSYPRSLVAVVPTESGNPNQFEQPSAMSVPYKQDMPPTGGFEAIKYKRNLPFRGPSGLVILGGVTAVCAYGFYRVGKGNLEKRELQREKVWSRIHLVPVLLAEGDRDAYRRQQAALEREKEIMKDVKGWEAGKSVYNNPRYRPADSIVVL